MPAATETPLPLTDTLAPADQAELLAALRQAVAEQSPIYPVGGGTSLDFGLPATAPGYGVSLAGLDRVIDYPARDMTITVEAGVTLGQLAETLGAERQQLPVDVPFPSQATIGGVIATNFNGPRRYGYGSLRDYVIGIHAIDGRGRPFKGGGRVVKNVAGYDFCKLLTGSLGTLGVIAQVTFKVRPLADRSAWLACEPGSLDNAERLLASLTTSATMPAAIQLLTGPAWNDEAALAAPGDSSAATTAGAERLVLLVAFEGTASEVDWQLTQLTKEWTESRAGRVRVLHETAALGLWQRMVEFPADRAAPLVLKGTVRPSGVTPFIAACRQVEPRVSIAAQAGSGVVLAKFPEFPADGLSRTLIAQLQPAALRLGGQVVILSNPSGAELTHRSVWGGGASLAPMTAVKQQFDPHNLLNRGRFVYP